MKNDGPELIKKSLTENIKCLPEDIKECKNVLRVQYILFKISDHVSKWSGPQELPKAILIFF